MTTYLGISGAGEGAILSHPVYTRDDSKVCKSFYTTKLDDSLHLKVKL